MYIVKHKVVVFKTKGKYLLSVFNEPFNCHSDVRKSDFKLLEYFIYSNEQCFLSCINQPK